MTIAITKNAKYNGQKENWTELKTGQFITSNDITCVHKSHKFIPEFKSDIITCVYDPSDSEEQLKSPMYLDVLKTHTVLDDRTHIVRPDNEPEHVYTIKIPKGTMINVYENEYRFYITQSFIVKYIGTMGTIRIEDLSSVYGAKTINVFTKKLTQHDYRNHKKRKNN